MDLTAPPTSHDRMVPRGRGNSDHPPVARRRTDVVLLVFAAVGFGLWIAMWAVLLTNRGLFGRFYGQDLAIYLEAADRWLNGSGFYHAYQLAGPYQVAFGNILYPPPSLLLFLPFTVIPVPFWWAIPLALLGASIWRLRPAPWAILGIVACLWWPDTIFRIILGNPVLWVVAFLALGATRPFFAPFALLKITLAPAALLNVRARAWWIGLGIVGIASLLYLPMWPDYARALANLRVDSALAYSVRELPMIAIPWLAWLGRARAR